MMQNNNNTNTYENDASPATSHSPSFHNSASPSTSHNSVDPNPIRDGCEVRLRRHHIHDPSISFPLSPSISTNNNTNTNKQHVSIVTESSGRGHASNSRSRLRSDSKEKDKENRFKVSDSLNRLRSTSCKFFQQHHPTYLNKLHHRHPLSGNRVITGEKWNMDHKIEEGKNVGGGGEYSVVNFDASCDEPSHVIDSNDISASNVVPCHHQPQNNLETQLKKLSNLEKLSLNIPSTPTLNDLVHLNKKVRAIAAEGSINSTSQSFRRTASGRMRPSNNPKVPYIPKLRPQHVYNPVAPLGILTLGKKKKNKNKTALKKSRDSSGDHVDINGNYIGAGMMSDGNDISIYSDDEEFGDESSDWCTLLLASFSFLLLIVTLPFSLCMTVKVAQEYERAVVFRLGRLRSKGAEGPGLFFILPCVDTFKKVDLRTVSFDVPPQEILSRDSVTVSVDAVVYYRVSNPTLATNNIEDYSHSTRLLAATTLRNVLGTKDLAEILSEREIISQVMQIALDDATEPWGVKAERVEIKDVRLPIQLQRSMAAEAEAVREARAKVIKSVGEKESSMMLREAAQVISSCPSAMQLRYLQTLNNIAAEHNTTIVFPMPINNMFGSTTKSSSSSSKPKRVEE